ncbi:AAA family ATPase [Bizionia saleffrena]|uniref:DNA 3'-5' helicase n=1 Tax=Bizionia saleffrena TaxID=291189 RepID=A0A8H2QLD0_9FLAO|nr:UvrD-helicase domain-containing protein [Bizionia saleffrena]TYB74085.1 AAA family ATPase [Bizionia saleffrena]
MSTLQPFTVYNASAGSGKTFTLVKEYLKILFASATKDQFKHILAITFTNKAVAEMKERIVDTLKEFSDPLIISEPSTIFSLISEELNIEPEVLHLKSKKILNTIMHNYAAFDISTIDGFNHRLIRTFAHDLKLPLNFEVDLDSETLLNEAVDRLISKAGTDKALTKVLIDFALEKADDDKSWDVARDFNTIAKLLINENDLKYVKTLEGKTLADFSKLKTDLIHAIATAENNIQSKAGSVLDSIAHNNLDTKDFSRGTLPNHFIKAKALNLNGLYDNQLQSNIAEGVKIYTKTLAADKKDSIDSLLPRIGELYGEIKKEVYNLKFLNSFYKNSTPLSVLNAINNELNAIKTEQNKMLISEFNAIISDELKNQPTPFIYERMGEKFRYYFIDEFQDTSEMQWSNLVPLIDNTLSGQNLKGEQGTAMLVGDAKQAIYRWRGGKAEQFIDLFNATSKPFQVAQKLENLPANYRSYQNIITFNNGFFKYLSAHAFSHLNYANLYEIAHQDSIKKEKGYVNIDFIDFEDGDDKNELYPEYVLNTITSCLENGFTLKEICIIVRKKDEGVAIAQYLSANGIKITSSQTMLINNSPEVQVANSVLTLLTNPNNDEARITILDFIAHKYNINDKHEYYKHHIKLPINEFFKSFEYFGIIADPKQIIQLGLFDVAESIVRTFKLAAVSNAYIQFYLDIVLEYTQKNISDISGFLDYFENKKDKLSIVSPENQDAVQIMTIHVSKGLEFPVVIFPYAQQNVYGEVDPKEWFKLEPEHFNNFEYTLLNYNKDFEFYGDEGLRIHEKHQAELELDNINLLYVTLTRAVEQLYIIAKKDISKKGEINEKSYSGLLINYLLNISEWQDNQLSYSFGSPTREHIPKLKENNTIQQPEFISTAKEDHNINIVTNAGYMWDTKQQDAIEKGNLVHDIMAQIDSEIDIENVMHQFLTSGTINALQSQELKNTIDSIINHPELKSYFSTTHTIYNERDIITKTGKLVRPDRLVINTNNEVVIIDYKTGLFNPKHQHQLQDYQDVLEEMQFKVTKKILVYINESISIKTY